MNEESFRILSTEGASVPTLARYVLGQPVQPNVARRIERVAEKLGVTLPKLATASGSSEKKVL